MTIKKPGLALLLALGSFFGLSQTALAAPCTAQIDALKAAMNEDICKSIKSCDGLNHKLDNAKHKLDKGQFDHAARRLADYGAIIEEMAMRKKPQISQGDYQKLLVPYVSALGCIFEPVLVEDEPPQDQPIPVDEGDAPALPNEGDALSVPNETI